MTRDELFRRIWELALDAERARPRNPDSAEGLTDALACILAVNELYAVATRIRPRDERRAVYRVA